MAERTEKCIYAVGIGPDGRDHITPAARTAVLEAQVVIGYQPYCKQIADLTSGKELIASGMGEEVTRAQQAIERAAAGSMVAVVSSGDAGVYGMAGLLLEMLAAQAEENIRVEVVPGVTAANAAAAVLGAPLMNDFVSISLSDLLTPRETISKRIQSAAEGDFVAVLYNPRSKKRHALLDETLATFMRYRGRRQCAGFVKNAGRENQESWLGTLADLPAANVDMATVVIIGNSATFLSNGRMITKRGYRLA